MVDTNNLTMVKFIHRSNHHSTPKPRQHRANAINASAPLASRECSRGCRRDGRHGIGRVRPGLSKVACPCRSLHLRGAPPGLHRISGHGRCSARHPCRIQPPKGVHGQKGEANAAESKNGNAGWNPGTALPERIGAKPERLASGRCGLNGFRRARGISSLHFTSSGMPARASALSLRPAPVNGCSRQSPKPASNC